MLAEASLQADLRHAIRTLERLPLPELLQRQGLLLPLLRRLARERLGRDLPLPQAARLALVTRICRELGCDTPAPAPNAWIGQLPEALQPEALQRWQELCVAQALEAGYGDRIEAHFLRRRPDLERVVFRLIRLEDPGLADELYLRLIDDGASFGDLAALHGVGEERHCRGIIGPLPLNQPHGSIRAALAALAPGEVHPPFSLEGRILLLRLEHRLPARLDPSTRQLLLDELLDADLTACLPGLLAAVAEDCGGPR